MRLLQLHPDGNYNFASYSDEDETPKYAILSHTWGKDDQEVTFEDIKAKVGKEKTGYRKLQFCRKQVLRDNLKYFWVDTCCIDKPNSTELSQSINSMFRWYENAERCYVFLSDVTTRDRKGAMNQEWLPQFKRSRWFTRGWTLQELLAPKSVEFFSNEGDRLGDKHSLVKCIHDVTRISILALKGNPLFQFSTDEKMSWASERVTKKGEDGAYCLMGLFKMHMPLIYGEGRENAMQRLRTVIQLSIYPPSFQRNRGPKYRKSFKSKRTPSNPDFGLPLQTHRDPNRRPLIRFDKGLVPLHTLWAPRDEQGSAELHIEEYISSLPSMALSQKFVTDVANICDYKCEDKTETAIGLEVTQQEPTSWVASSSSPEETIVSFLKSLLPKVSTNLASKGLSSSIAARDVFKMCIKLASLHIEACGSALLVSVERYLEALNKTIWNETPPLVEWLKSWAHQDSPIAFCYFAYRNSGSKSMHMVARVSTNFVRGTKHGLQHSFELCVHHIQRLRRYCLAAAAMLPCGRRLPELRKDYQVEGFTIPPVKSLSPFDISANHESIAVRVYPAEPPDLNRHQQALPEMKGSNELFQHFQKNDISPQVKPHVHTGVQVSEWFHAGDRLFAADGSSIACSRSSCLCCKLYFRHHTGHFKELYFDQRTCLSWRPHELNVEKDYPMSEEQQNILINAMIEDIPEGILHHIHERLILKDKDLIIMTDIKNVNDLRLAKRFSAQARTGPFRVAASLDLTTASSKNRGVSVPSAPCFRRIHLSSTHDVGVAAGGIYRHPRNTLFGRIPSGFDNFMEDSDDEGGILL